jgi:hypothetical protein
MVEYEYKVFWSDRDNSFVATCTQFPSLSWLAPTEKKALIGMKGLVESVVKDLEAGN